MWWFVAILAAAQPDVVDRVVAVVAGEPILASDVRLEAALETVDLDAAPFFRLGDAEGRVMATAMIRNAASRLVLIEPDGDAVRNRLEAIRGQFSEHAKWSTWLQRTGVDEEGLIAALRRRILVERFLERDVAQANLEPEAYAIAVTSLLEELALRIPARRVPAFP